MKQFSFLDRTWHQVEDIRQFVFTDGPDRGRRRVGMPFWIRYQEDPPSGPGLLVQERITDEDPSREWMEKAINLGAIYMTVADFNITRLALDKFLEMKK